MTSKNIRTFEIKMGKRALILFIMGMSCLLFIVFLFGVTVGKNIDTYPEKYARGVPGKILERLGLSSNRTETAEIVSETSKESAKAGGQETGSEEKIVPETVPAGTDEKQPAAQATVSTQKQKPPAMPVAEQVKIKPSPVKEKYQIQVVSFKEKDKADQLCKKLTDLGFSPKNAVMELPEKGKWFRVTLEGFESKEQAQKAVDNMTRKIKGLNCVIHKMETKNN
ncbi:MAG: SPOR domain-containing protein [Deltaproteobacteria bacterium]|nr:SPOR domain-containing protein [Deltaproteobacteria bacterium]